MGTSVRRRRLHGAMHDAFGPGRRARRRPARLRAARREQAALAAAVERALATGEHLVAEAGTGTGKSLAYLIPALESGSASSSRPRRRRSRSSCSRRTCPRPRARSAARCASPCSRGARTTSAASSSRASAPMLLRDARDEEAFEALQPWLDGDRDGRPRRAAARAVGGALGRARGRRRPLRRPPLPVPLDRASPRRRGRGRARPSS